MVVFLFPLIGVVTAPIGAFVLLKIVQTFVSIRNFFTAWVTTTYVLLVIQAIALSVMLFRLLPTA
jgi:hypothetical protein